MVVSEMSVSSVSQTAGGQEEDNQRKFVAPLAFCCCLLVAALLAAFTSDAFKSHEIEEDVSEDKKGDDSKYSNKPHSGPPAKDGQTMTTTMATSPPANKTVSKAEPTSGVTGETEKTTTVSDMEITVVPTTEVTIPEERTTTETITSGTTTKSTTAETTTTKATTTKTTTTKATTTKTTTTKATTTTMAVTTTPGPIKELYCAVGALAVFMDQYPADGTCHYLYYMDVFMDKERNVLAAELNTSLETFKNVLKTYSRTKGGLSFDIKYVTADDVKNSARNLETLASGNIGNYGFLNMIGPIRILEAWVKKAKELVQELKNLQGKDPSRRTIIAMGTFRYNEGTIWTTYQSLFKTAVATGYGADVVIVVTSTHLQEDITKCKVLPPSIVNASDPNYTSFNRLEELVTNSYPHTNKHITVGVSVQRSPLSYKHTEKITNVNQLQLYKACDEFIVTSLDTGCDLEKKVYSSKILVEGLAVGVQKGSDRYFAVYETGQSLVLKVRLIKDLPPWYRFAWLVYNVHMVDPRLACPGSAKDKHAFLTSLKKIYEM